MRISVQIIAVLILFVASGKAMSGCDWKFYKNIDDLRSDKYIKLDGKRHDFNNGAVKCFVSKEIILFKGAAHERCLRDIVCFHEGHRVENGASCVKGSVKEDDATFKYTFKGLTLSPYLIWSRK